MNNLLENLKRIFLNRNMVTILGVIAGVIVLWFIYSQTLNKAIEPVRVPVANKDLPAGTAITKDDFEFVEINNDVLKKASIITSSARLTSKYVNNGTSITKGAMFYQSQVVEKDELIKRDLEIAPEGYHIYRLKVNNTNTYANSIYPGDKIDLWLKAEDDGNLIYEEFITSIEVLSVKDERGLNVFDVASGRTPAYLSFAVPENVFAYLSNIEYLAGMQLFPVPKNTMYSEMGKEPVFANDRLVSFIDSKVYQINYNHVDNSNNINNNNNNNNENPE